MSRSLSLYYLEFVEHVKFSEFPATISSDVLSTSFFSLLSWYSHYANVCSAMPDQRKLCGWEFPGNFYLSETVSYLGMEPWGALNPLLLQRLLCCCFIPTGALAFWGDCTAGERRPGGGLLATPQRSLFPLRLRSLVLK